MSAPRVEIIRRAAMEFDQRSYGSSNWFGVAAVLQVGNHKFTSETPQGAGDAETINRDVDAIVSALRDAR